MAFVTRMSNGKRTGIYYIDSTYLAVCRNQRINKHKVLKGLAERGKTSMGWFFGFKLHIIINNLGEMMNIKITKDNISDLKVTDKLAKNLSVKLFGDKGYISKSLYKDLLLNGLELFTKCRKNMKQKKISALNKLLLYKRGIVETVIGQLKIFYNIDIEQLLITL